MKVYFIGAGPGAADLLTLRGRDIIARAPVCLYAGSLVPREVIAHAPVNATVINTAPLSLPEIIAHFEAAAARHQDVARVHSGDPSIYGAIGEQMAALDARGISYEIVPGVPAFAAAAACLKRELTLPGVAQSVVLTRTAKRASAMPEGETLANFAATGTTLAVHLSAKAVEDVVAALTPYYGANCPAAVVARASWPDEVVLQGTLATIAKQSREANIERTALILVGPVLSGNVKDTSALYSPRQTRYAKEKRE